MRSIKVLIDNDILIQLEKQLKAEKLKYQLDCYFSIDDFLNVAEKYSRDTFIYLGVDLIKYSDLNFKNVLPLSDL